MLCAKLKENHILKHENEPNNRNQKENLKQTQKFQNRTSKEGIRDSLQGTVITAPKV